MTVVLKSIHNNNKFFIFYLYPIYKSNEYNNLSKYKLGTGYLK